MSIELVQKFYVGFYGRPADVGGLEYWVERAEVEGWAAVRDAFANSPEAQKFVFKDPVTCENYTNEELVNNIYQNLFGRDAELEGLEFYTSKLESGEMTLCSIVENIADGAKNTDAEVLENKIDLAEYFTDHLSNKNYLYTEAQIPDSRSVISGQITDADMEAAYDAVEDTIADFPYKSIPGNIFTLIEPSEVWIPGKLIEPPHLMWGYTPGCQGVDQGIPVEDLLEFVTTITGLDLYELGLIDDDGVGSFDNVESLEISLGVNYYGDANSNADSEADPDVEANGGIGDEEGTGGDGFDERDDVDASANKNSSSATSDSNTGDLTINFLDGGFKTAECCLGEQYFNFLNNLLFFETESGRLTSRLYMSDPVYVDADGKIIPNGEAGTTIQYTTIVLTPTENNGGTVEYNIDGTPCHTSDGEDTIIAGRLELLHEAYIDAAGGYDVLEIDAKGYYAQPLALLNIEHIIIENLPNVYTDLDWWGEISDTYPDLDPDLWGPSLSNSVIDISRATSLELLTVTESGFDGLSVDLGSLTVAGIRNNATVRLEGAFTEDINLHFSQGLTGPITVELLIGEITADLNFAHNTSALHLVSLGGVSNTFHSHSLGGHLTDLVISGDAFLGISGDLDYSFVDCFPVTIDASENTGGVSLKLSNSENVTFLGSSGDDRFIVDTADAYNSLGWMYDNDQIVTIYGSQGDNYYEIDTYTAIVGASEDNMNVPADGDGNNNYEIDAVVTQITTGNGNNDFEGEVVNFTATVGDGNNRFDLKVFDSPQSSVWYLEDDVDSSVTIQAGDGSNVFNIASSPFHDLDMAIYTVVDYIEDLLLDAHDGPDDIIGTDDDLNTLDEMGELIDAATDSVDPLELLGVALEAVYHLYSDGMHVLQPVTIDIKAGDGGNVINIPGLPYDLAANIVYLIEDAARELLDKPDLDLDLDGLPEILSYLTGVLNIVNVETGAGDDDILVAGSDLTVSSGAGDDVITLLGLDSDYVEEVGFDVGLFKEDLFYISYSDGAILDIDTGSGQDTIELGASLDPAFLATGSITAMEGSKITGENITLFVNTFSDLRAAELSGITRVILDDDSLSYVDSPQANDGKDDNGEYNTDIPSDRAILTLTSEQFEAIGAENFSVQGAIFNTHAFVKIIVTESTSLTDLGVDSLPRNIDLYFEVQDGVTLTMTAEQLHTRVAPQGVMLENDGNTDYANGKVVITGGGFDFDPFNASDTAKSVISGTKYVGGSLSNDFAVDGPDAGEFAGDSQSEWYNVTVQSVYKGYNRPADAEVVVVLTIDSNTLADGIIEAFDTWHTNLEIVGEQDITSDGPIKLGMLNDDGVYKPTNPFYVDFTALEANVNGLIIDNFELLAQGGGIYGNSDNGYSSEILIHLAGDNLKDLVGFDQKDDPETLLVTEEEADSLVSSGVERYIVTQIDGLTAAGAPGSTATIKLCDTAQDIEVFGLRGNYNDTLIIVDAAWGLVFELQGGGTAKAEGPTGSSNVGALIANYEWPGAEAVVNMTHSVSTDTRPIISEGIRIDNADSIIVNSDASDTTIKVVNGDDVDALYLNTAGNMSITDSLPESLTIIDGAGVVGDLTLSVNGMIDLSQVTLINIDEVVLEEGATLVLSMAQADTIGPGNFSLADGATAANLNIVDFDGELFAAANYPEGYKITLRLANDPVVTLHPDTDLTSIDDLEVPEGTVLELTAAQFLQLENDAITGAGSVHIIGLTQAQVGENGEDLDLDGIDIDGEMTITLAESVDLSAADIYSDYNSDPRVDIFNIGDGMTLILGDIQNADGVSIVGGTNSTLQFTDTSGFLEQIDASGIDVDILKITNLLVSGNNVDYMFQGLSERVEKVIYNAGNVEGRTQIVDIEAGSTIMDDVSFNEYLLDVEVTHLEVNMLGGTEISGDLVMSTVEVNWADDQLVPFYLQELVINSTGTAENINSGSTDNTITGDITPAAYGPAVTMGSRDNNLKCVTINADQNFVLEGAIIFNSHGLDDYLGNNPEDGVTANDDDEATATLTINGVANVSLGGVDIADNDVDALEVVNAGTGTLSLTLNDELIDQDDALSFTGSNIELTVVGSFDLSDDDTTGVSAMTLENGATLKLSMPQINTIGIGNFALVDGATAANLNIVDFDGEPFAVEDFPEGYNITVTLVNDPVVTLHADTDLTSIDDLEVPEGTVLELTAAQFLQLENDAITGAGSVHIIGLTQAQVGDNGEDFDLDGIDIEGELRITLAESVDLSAADIYSDYNGDPRVDVFNIGDGMKLTLGDIQDADGISIAGGSNSTLQFTDTSGFLETIDASGFDVDFLRITNILVSGNNVDYLFQGLSERVVKVIYNDIGNVEGREQVANIESGSTIFGDISFNEYLLDVEVTNLEVNMLGGTEIDGDLVMSTVLLNEGGVELIPFYLQELTINSTGTEANLISGSTENIITGDITPAAYGPAVTMGSRDNNLKCVTINADQNFVLEGAIIFNSHGLDDYLGNNPDDGVTANDDDEATVTLNVSGDADVSLDDLDIGDDDIDALIVTHDGAGTLEFELDGDLVDDVVGNTDSITVNGSVTGTTIVRVSDEIDLSDDTLNNVSQLVLEEDAVLTIHIDQLIDIGYANISVLDEDGNPLNDEAILHIIGLDNGDVFDATLLDEDITVASITIVAGSVALDPNTDLTGVGQINVYEGSTLTLTAAQFQQLQGAGTIVGLDVDGDDLDGNPFTVNITDLTQADVDYDVDNTFGETDGFDLSDISDGATVNLDLAEDVDLAANTDLDDLDRLQVILADGQTLGLNNGIQADGLNVTGGVDSTVVFQFDSIVGVVPGGQIDASGYDITTLKALATFVGGTNVEYLIDDLASDVELRLYHDPAELGFLSPTYRYVFIEETVTVPAGLIFNDWDTTDEVRTLTIVMDGGVEIDGKLSLPTRTDKDGDLVQQFFDTLTIVSQGDVAAANIDTDATFNLIDGDIDTIPAGPAPENTFENNLLNVVITATTQDFVIDGAIVFQSNDASDDPDANLTVTGASDVTIQQLDVSDGEISILNVANSGTGVLTITGGSPAIFDDAPANLETINFSGTGDIILGSNDDVATEWGISAAELSTIDASGLSGDLDLGQVRNIDSANFEFTAGSGVTMLTLTSDTLDVDLLADPADIGWNFDFSNAAAGSEFHLGSPAASTLNFVDGPLNIDLGANTTLFIDETMDLTGIDLTIIQTLDIVLADGAILTLTADQANGLNIVAGPDTGAAGIDARVNVIDLGNDAVDLSGIADDIAGYVYLEDDDVTLDAVTDLGGFTVALIANSPEDYNPGGGQTIRFTDNTEAQADGREIIVIEDALDPANPTPWDVPGDDTNNLNSTNVAWLFDTIPGQLDTTGYDGNDDYKANIGRLWVSADLIDSVGGNVENLFNYLPDTILRVDFNSVEELDIQLASYATERKIELTSFTTIGGLTEIDDDILPMEEHIETLRIAMGGEVTVGNILIGDVVAAPDTDPLTPEFEQLWLNSRVALDDDHYLATEDYVNDNDGTNESGEHTQPADVNIIGDIGVGGTNLGIDLLNVGINTYGPANFGLGDQTPGTYPVGSPYTGDDGADLVVGTLTFDRETGAVDPDTGVPVPPEALLTVTGTNDVTFKSVDTTDADITMLNLDLTLHAGTFLVTGGSPALDVDNTETVNIVTGTADPGQPNTNVYFGYNWVDADADDDMDADEFTIHLDGSNVPYAGVNGGDDLSFLNVAGLGTVNLGVIAQIDGTDDDTDGDGIPNQDAFFLNGSDKFLTSAILGKGNVNGTPLAPSLAAGSTWRFEDVTLTLTEDVNFVTGNILELHNVDLIINGDVDLTKLVDDPLTPAVEGLFLTGNTTIWVPKDQSLKLTVQQVLDLPIDITGEGTVIITGDASDVAGADFGEHLRVANVDISAVTLDGNPADLDDDGILELYLQKVALDDNGDPTGHNVIGSANDDDLKTDGEDDSLTGGAGDDTMRGGAGSDTYYVDKDTDTIINLRTTANSADVLVVSNGATAIAARIQEFIATAETTNDGTAKLSSDDGGATIDVSLAGGSKGFELTGAGITGPGTDVLIGSNQDDLINGGANTAGGDNNGEEDELTGSGGKDTFIFDITLGDPADMTVNEATAPDDKEFLGVADSEDNDIPDVGFIINYAFNGVGGSVEVAAGDVDVSDVNDIAAAMATAIDDLNGVAATSLTFVVSANAEDGNSFEFSGITVTGSPIKLASPDFVTGDGGDVAQKTEVVFSGTVNEGDIYTVLTVLANGENIGASYEAVAGDGLAEIADGLGAAFNLVAPNTTVNATSDGVEKITFDDEDADNGGFDLTATPQGSIDGTGASSLLTGVETTLDDADADVIMDFTTQQDKIRLGIKDGTFGNYFEDAGQADFQAAYLEAENQFDGSKIYYLTSTAADEGLLFFDANSNGDADGVLQLIGVNNTNFDYTDIAA